ncbi:DUF6571 family protein [Mumia quercus]|uniref:DUF6571 family protein n=1 Tax=Mumia quercus TaxID=2976125 RepID=UPI0021D05F20|nr:DUF6571 family protein [Mumia quercus]
MRLEGTDGGAPVTHFPIHEPSGDTVVSRGRSVQATAGDVENFSTTAQKKHAQARAGVVGVIATAMEGAPKEVVRNAGDVARTALSGGGTIAWFGGRIADFNAVVTSLNTQLAREPRETQAALREKLQPRYASALEDLERDGRTARTRLEKPLDQRTITDLYAAGALPSFVGNVFPAIDFSKVKLTALPCDLAGMSDEQLADHLLKNPELAYLMPVVPVETKKIIGKELAERARNLSTVDPQTQKRSFDGFEEFATVLEAYGSDAIVSTAFLNDLGPKGFLELSGRVALAAVGDRNSDLFSAHEAKVLARMQDALAGTLAAGTHRPTPGHPAAGPVPDSDSYVSEQWVTDLLAQGRQLIRLGEVATDGSDEVYGYQVLAPLLEHENSNADFLNRVGLDMIGFEREYAAAHKGTLPWDATSVTATAGRLDWREGSTDDVPAGTDPVGGLMRALSTNADAARDFFTSSAESSDGETRLPMVDYLLTDREWKGDGVHDARGWNPPLREVPDPSGIGYLGDALKAATLHDPDQRSAQIVESIINETYREHTEGDGDKKRFSEKDIIDPALRTDLTEISVRYMSSVFTGMGPPDDAKSVDTSDSHVFSDARFGPDGEASLRLFLAELGKDDGARESLASAATSYARTEMMRQLDGVSPSEVEAEIGSVSMTSAKVLGSIDAGAVLAIIEESHSGDEAKNKELDTGASIGGAVVGEATKRVPVVGEAVKLAVAELAKSLHEDSKGEANLRIQPLVSESADAHEKMVRDAIWRSVPEAELPPGLVGKDIDSLSGDELAAYKEWKADSPWGAQMSTRSMEAEKYYAQELLSAKLLLEGTR